MSDIKFARNRFTWSNELIEYLKKGCLSMFERQLSEIVKENHRLTGAPGYSSNGMGYCSPAMRVFTLRNKPQGLTLAPLHPLLEARHSDWLASYEDFLHQSKRVSQTLLTLLGKATNQQDMRDMLPDITYRVFPQNHPLSVLTRSRPDLYACGLEDAVDGYWDPKMVSTYSGVSSLVDTYIGYSLL